MGFRIGIGNIDLRNIRSAFSWSAWGSHLYISNSGSDANHGHNEANAITPEKLVGLTLKDGQKIHFKAGETFNNFNLNIPADNVIIDSYGTGGAPILSGSSVITASDWTSEGGGVYSIIKADVKWLYLDDIIVENAKTNYIQAASWPAANKIRVSAANKAYLNGFTNLVGLELRIFDNGYFRITFPYTIINYDPVNGDITVDRNINAATGTNHFFIYNYSEFLANEKWYWDGIILKLQTALTFADHIVSIGFNNVGLNVTGDNCTIQNIELKHYQTKAINCYNKTINVTNCKIHDCRGNAIYISGNNAIPIINDNIIYNIGNNGVFCGAVASGEIKRNTIYNMGMGVDTGWPVTESFASVPGYPYLSNFGTTDDHVMYTGRGIGLYSDYTQNYFLNDSLDIEYNILYNIAGDGMVIGGDNHIIKYNIIYNYAGLFDDIAGIHTGTGSAAIVRDSSCNNLIIKQNFVYDPAKLAAWSAITTNTTIIGIYTDYKTTNCDIDGNIIYGGTIGRSGIYIYEYCSNIRIFNNIIKDYNTSCISGSSSATISNIKIYDNIFYSSLQTQIAIYSNYYGGGGYLDRNKYIDPSYSNILKLLITSYTLAAWTAATGQDTNSDYIQYNGAILYKNETTEPVLTSITTGYKDIDGNDITSVLLQPFTAIIVFKKTTLLTGLLDFWKLDEAAGDAVGINANVLTNFNIVVYGAGKINNCADFGLTNPNKSLNLNSVFGMTYVSSRSMSVWVNVNNIPGPGDFTFAVTDITFATNPGNYTSITYRRSGGALRLYCYTGYYNVTLTPGTWYHIVITWDHGSNISKLYLNGILRITSTSFTADYSAFTNQLSVGNARTTIYASIKADEFGLWNKILTIDEVLDLYNNGSGISHPFF